MPSMAGQDIMLDLISILVGSLLVKPHDTTIICPDDFPIDDITKYARTSSMYIYIYIIVKIVCDYNQYNNCTFIVGFFMLNK